MQKTKSHLITKAARNGSWQAADAADEQLESMVSELLDEDPACGAQTGSTQADLLAARNGGSQAAGRTLREEEIESLLERMVFSEQAFLKYSH